MTKKEVTHILELGNPEDGALYNKDKNDKDINKDNGCIIVKDNERWNGLADDTISTEMLNDKDLNDLENNKNLDKSFVKFVYNDDGTEVKHLKFFGDNAGKVTDAKTAKNYVKELKVKDSTKVYVADQRNNNLKEVKDMDEAISLLGYKDVNKNIYSVYAGYDDESLTTAQNSKFEEGTAKYVVFNVTNKDNNIDDNYRIETVPGNNGSATLLNTDNELVDEDFFKFTNLFPLSTFKQYDVVKIKVGSDGKAKAYRELEHSETDDYPIVKITKVKKDGKVLEVEGEDYKTVIFVDDADLFGKSSLSKLEKGDIVQLKLNEKDTKEENKNVIDIVSVLKDEKVEGKLKKAGFIKVVQDNGYIGTMTQKPGEKTVSINRISLIDNDDTYKTTTYNVDKNVATALSSVWTANSQAELQFIVQDDDNASDFEVKVNGKWVPLNDGNFAVAGINLEKAIAAANKANATLNDKTLTQAIATATTALNASDATVESLTEATTVLNTAVATKAVSVAKTAVEKVEVNPLTWATSQKDTQTAVQTAVEEAVGKLNLKNVKLAYGEAINVSSDGARETIATVSVTINSAAVNSVKDTATVNVTVNANPEVEQALESAKTALTEAISKAEETNKTLNDKTLTEAIATANNALKAQEATTETLTQATTTLNAAVKTAQEQAQQALESAKTALTEAIAAANKENETLKDKTLTQAITDAQQALDAEKATVESLTEATTALNAAVKTAQEQAQQALESAKTALTEAIAAANKENETLKDETLTEAIATANTALNAPEATTETLTQATTALNAAVKTAQEQAQQALESAKTALTEAIAAANKENETLKDETLTEAITDAQQALKAQEATTETLTQATTTLNAAVKTAQEQAQQALESAKTALTEAIAAANKENETLKDETLTEAIATANNALKAQEATTETLTQATTTLNNTVAAAQAVQTAETAVEKVEVNPLTWATSQKDTQTAVQTAVKEAVGKLNLKDVKLAYGEATNVSSDGAIETIATVSVTITSTAVNSVKDTATVNVTVNANPEVEKAQAVKETLKTIDESLPSDQNKEVNGVAKELVKNAKSKDEVEKIASYAKDKNLGADKLYLADSIYKAKEKASELGSDRNNKLLEDIKTAEDTLNSPASESKQLKSAKDALDKAVKDSTSLHSAK